MKTKFYLALSVMLSFTLMSFNCSGDDDSPNPNDNSEQIVQIENTAESGTWRIANFNDSGQDETSDFTGYDFTFNSDGSLIATNGTTTLTGTWSVTDDSSSDDSSSDDDIDFNIFFPVPETNDFEDLNDDWDIVSTSSTQIALIDISGGNGGTDILTFEKN
ncbi:hypothetical protein SAMN04515667_1619 [Formosa sp. Hel1_31_208]|uniref:hypothetical protein n=1 Tax=Formosa sp. Hel1_31_208 TaxID=1798225 RepID=UPI00087A6DB6|nr:hypothetical protein [Formosa sp. Hel1_31_208]SDS19326.1 hypothetical protein SAMN04515667_1619 [Formosa sp. Hel1_31_208]